MSKIVAILATSAALMIAAPAIAQDRTSNSNGGASFEALPNASEPGYGYSYAPAQRQVRVRAPQGRFIELPKRESGASKRG